MLVDLPGRDIGVRIHTYLQYSSTVLLRRTRAYTPGVGPVFS